MYGGLLTGLYVTPARLTLKSTSSIPRGDYGDDDKGVREPASKWQIKLMDNKQDVDNIPYMSLERSVMLMVK